MLGCLVLLAGCFTPPRLSPVNLTEPGWHVRNGQAVWRFNKDAPELAGEVSVATHTSGRSLVQFTKTPLPFVVARREPGAWEIEFPPRNRRFGGHGAPWARFGWLHLAACLQGQAAPKGWTFEQLPEGRWRLANPSTGEQMEGWLAP